MTELARFYSGLPYPIQVEEDTTTGGGICYVARHPDLPGCMSHGTSLEEAIANLEEAKRLFIESMLESGLYPPPPSASVKSWTVTTPESYRIEGKTLKSEARGEIVETERVDLCA